MEEMILKTEIQVAQRDELTDTDRLLIDMAIEDGMQPGECSLPCRNMC